jgi:hypothetical protein
MSTAAASKQRHIVGKGKNAHWVKWSGTQWVYDGKAKQGTSPAPSTPTPPSPQAPSQPQGRNRTVYEAWKSGKSVADLAKEHGLSEATVRQIIYKEKVQSKGAPASPPVSSFPVSKPQAPPSTPSGKGQAALYDALSPEDKEKSDTGGVVGADPEALQYVRDNFDRVFGKASLKNVPDVPQYMRKMVSPNVDSLYGGGDHWSERADLLWKVLEEGGGAWTGSEEEDKKLAQVGKEINETRVLIDSQHAALRLGLRPLDVLSIDPSNQFHWIVPKWLPEGSAIRDKLEQVASALDAAQKAYFSNNTPATKSTWENARKDQGEVEAQLKSKMNATMKGFLGTFDATKHTLQDYLDLYNSGIQALIDSGLLGSQESDRKKTLDDRLDLKKYPTWGIADSASKKWLESKSEEWKKVLSTKPAAEAAIWFSEEVHKELLKHEDKVQRHVLDLSASLNHKATKKPHKLVSSPLTPLEAAGALKGGADLAARFSPRVKMQSGRETKSFFAEWGKMGKSNTYRPILSSLQADSRPEVKDLANFMVAQSGTIKLKDYLRKSNPDVDVPPMSKSDFHQAVKGQWDAQSRVSYLKALMRVRESFYKNAFRPTTHTGSKSKFTLRSASSDERRNIIDKIQTSWDARNHGHLKYRINNIFKIDDSPMEKAFQATKARMGQAHGGTRMLWHGTDFVAGCSINRDQFRIGKAKVGRMLGNGVYFAKNASKSAQYLSESGFSRHGTHGVLFLTEVATGDMQKGAFSRASANTAFVDAGDKLGSRVMVNAEYAVKDPTQAIPRYWIDLEML